MASGEVERFTAQTTAAPIYPQELLSRRRQDEKLDDRVLSARRVEKRGLLDIDLNVAPPEDGGSDQSPAAEIQEAILAAATDASEVKASSGDEIEAHLPRGEITDEKNQTKNINAVTDSENGEAKRRKSTRWDALLEAGEHALRGYEESARDGGGKARNRRRRPCREAEIDGAESERGAAAAARNKKMNTGEGWAAPVVVVRSTRARAVAMPDKYREAVFHAAALAAEARFSRHRKSR